MSQPQLLTLAESTGSPVELMVADARLGAGLLLSGELAAARDHLEQARPRID